MSAAAPRWQPILHGDEAAAARRAVTEIAAALATARDPVGYDLANGAAGGALLFGYRARVEHDAEHRALAATLLVQAGDHLVAAPTSSSLFHGFPGIAWAADHLGALLGERDLADNDEIDEAILARLGSAGPGSGFDLVTGVVGLGVYALERLGHPAADRCAQLVVAQLAATARRAPGGLVWWVASGDPAPVDLGLAHGVPGVIALLARCAGLAGGTGDTARELLGGAVRWLLQQQRAGGSVFPSTLVLDHAGLADRHHDPSVGVPSARSGWCYGDAAVALAILRASAVGERAWFDDALAIARRAALRPRAEARVRDATLCHGAAALGLIYQRLHHATGDPAMYAAAREWVLRIFDYRMSVDSLAASAGFFQATLGEPVADRGLMNGAAGIGLVLLAACSDLAPDWDRALLLS